MIRTRAAKPPVRLTMAVKLIEAPKPGGSRSTIRARPPSAAARAGKPLLLPEPQKEPRPGVEEHTTAVGQSCAVTPRLRTGTPSPRR